MRHFIIIFRNIFSLCSFLFSFIWVFMRVSVYVCITSFASAGLLMEQTLCKTCSATSEPLLRSNFVHFVYAAGAYIHVARFFIFFLWCLLYLNFLLIIFYFPYFLHILQNFWETHLYYTNKRKAVVVVGAVSSFKNHHR